MSRTVVIKFEQGDPVTVPNVPDNVSVEQVKQSITKKFPDRKIIGHDTTDYKPGAAAPKPGEKPAVDIDKSSDKQPAAAPAEDKKDYRADFPTLYTPPGFIRNKRGDLIYY